MLQKHTFKIQIRTFWTDLNFSRDEKYLIQAANLVCKAILITQSPYDSNWDTGTRYGIGLDDLRFRDDFLMDTMSLRRH